MENQTPVKTELDEPVLPLNYPVHHGYCYVMDGVPRVNIDLMQGTVRDLMRVCGVSEVRRCDIVGRALS